MSVLRLQGIWKKRGKAMHVVHALQDVSLNVEAGEFVLVEGPSGVGKTTLLAVAAGLLQPDSGTVSLAGSTLQNLKAAARRKHRARTTGFVFQRSNLLGALTVRENVRIMAAIAGIPDKVADQETMRLLDTLGIASLENRSPESLSGGEEQRVALARALVHKPAVVFADEPTGSLDSTSGKVVAERLQHTAKLQGAAVVVATHDPRLTDFANRRLHMMDGQLFEDS